MVALGISFRVFLILFVRTLAIAEEPQCPRLYFEENILEKMVAMELKMEQTLDRLNEMEEKERQKHKSKSYLDQMSPPLTVEDLEHDGWRMIFRATSGNGHSVYDAWLKGDGSCDAKPVSMERSRACHYRDKVVSDWSSLGVQYVKFALFEENREVVHVMFNGVGSDVINWFDKTRVVSSSWSDLTAQHSYNIFSIAGHDGQNFKRRFHINRSYNGCDEDIGHLVVSDVGTSSGCLWDIHPVYPQFLYSKINSADHWNRRQFGRADYMAIFVRTE